LPSGESLNVLVVEDDPDERFLIATLLKREGYRVSAAENGLKALELMGASVPDLVLLDLHMPVLSGRDVLQELRSQHPRLPVVIVSGAEDAAEQILGLGAAALLPKPFSVRDLVATVSAVAQFHQNP
jgi:DNA-binding response OmpR family regulator